MRDNGEIRSDRDVFYGNVVGFDEHGEVVLRGHGKRGKKDTMTLSQFNRKAWEAASRARQK